MEKYKQPGFLNNRGQVSTETVQINLNSDLDNTFVTEGQKNRARELIQLGRASNADEAREVMRKEDLEENLDQYTLKK